MEEEGEGGAGSVVGWGAEVGTFEGDASADEGAEEGSVSALDDGGG